MLGRRFPHAAALCVAVVLLAACAGGNTSNGAVGTVLDASFERFDGSQGNFTQYRDRPLVVNFFASTCQPCRVEMPAFEEVHRDLGDRVTFVGVNVQDTVEDGKAFAAQVGITWDLVRDPTAAILTSLGGIGLPTTVLVDRSGTIVYLKLGKLDQGELRRQIDEKLRP